jgi:hypothetical protein
MTLAVVLGRGKPYPNIRYKMKMQMWKILILPTVYNESICLQMKFFHKALDC